MIGLFGSATQKAASTHNTERLTHNCLLRLHAQAASSFSWSLQHHLEGLLQNYLPNYKRPRTVGIASFSLLQNSPQRLVLMSRRRRFLASGTEPPSEVGVKISDFNVEVGKFRTLKRSLSIPLSVVRFMGLTSAGFRGCWRCGRMLNLK